MDGSWPGSSVHGILQARILEWIAISFSRVASWPRDETWVFCIAGRFFTIWVTNWPCNLWVWLYLIMPHKCVSFSRRSLTQKLKMTLISLWDMVSGLLITCLCAWKQVWNISVPIRSRTNNLSSSSGLFLQCGGPTELHYFIWGIWACTDYSIHEGFWSQSPAYTKGLLFYP